MYESENFSSFDESSDWSFDEVLQDMVVERDILDEINDVIDEVIK